MLKAHSVLQLIMRTDGTLIYQFPLGLGTCSGYTGRMEDTQLFFKFTSFLNPCTIYHVNLGTDEMVMNAEKYKLSNGEICCSCFSKHKNKFEVPYDVFRNSLPKGFDHHNFKITQVFYASKDRTTKVSMFLVHKKVISQKSHHTL